MASSAYIYLLRICEILTEGKAGSNTNQKYIKKLTFVQGTIGSFVWDVSNWMSKSSCLEFDIHFDPFLIRSCMFKLKDGCEVIFRCRESANKHYTSVWIFHQSRGRNCKWEFCGSKILHFSKYILFTKKQVCKPIINLNFGNSC